MKYLLAKESFVINNNHCVYLIPYNFTHYTFYTLMTANGEKH